MADPDASTSAGVDRETIKVVYQEICREHGVIADFRAKLLALIPIASAGVFLFLEDKFPAERADLMIPVGLVGALVTTGLFLYELRGIHRCTALRLCAAELEQEFVGPYVGHGAHSYLGDPEGIGLATNSWAALIIYPALIAAWSFMVFFGLAPLLDASFLVLGALGLPHLGALATGLAACLLGRRTLGRARAQREKDHAGCRYVADCMKTGRYV